MGSVSQSMWDCMDVCGYAWHFGVVSVWQRHGSEGTRSTQWTVGWLLEEASSGRSQGTPCVENRQVGLCTCCARVCSWTSLWGPAWMQPAEFFETSLWVHWPSYMLCDGYLAFVLHVQACEARVNLWKQSFSLWTGFLVKDIHNAFKKAQSFPLSQRCSRSLFIHFAVGWGQIISLMQMVLWFVLLDVTISYI